MTMKTIDCAGCGASVPYGRLSCSSCGALLASVTGGHRPAVRIVDAGPGSESVVEAAPAVARQAAPAVALAEVAVQAHVRARPRTSAKRRRASDAAAEAVVASVAAPPSLAPTVKPVPEPALKSLIRPLPEPVFAGLVAPPPVGAADVETPWAPLSTPDPVLVARPYQRHLANEIDAGADPAGLPGAYRPPVDTPVADAVVGAAAVGPAAGAIGKPGTARPIAGPVDAVAMVEIAGWFAIVGSAMGLLGFLLPWSVTVIGSSGFGGYFNGWGLASPTHAFVFVGLLVALGLGIVNTPVPHWLRSGVLGLALGGILVGLTWPYLVGPLGADVGVIVTALGGLALVIGGVVASWATRHAEPDPRV